MNRNNRRYSYSIKKKEFISEKTGGRCHLCHEKLSGYWEVDHIVPVVKDGDSNDSNLLPVCSKCNRYRWSYESDEFRQILIGGIIVRREIKKKTALGKILEDLIKKRESDLFKRRKDSKNYSTSNTAELKNHFLTLPQELSLPLIQILEWAIKRNLVRGTRSKSAAFSIGPSSSQKFITFFPDGKIQLLFNLKNYNGDVSKRNKLFVNIKKLGLFDGHINPDKAKEKRILNKLVSELDSPSLNNLLKYLESASQ